jgi:hypothetical protein
MRHEHEPPGGPPNVATLGSDQAGQPVIAWLQARYVVAGEQALRAASYHDAWPSQPHLDVAWAAIPRFGPLNAVARFLLGAMHEDGHVGQMREVLRQASG